MKENEGLGIVVLRDRSDTKIGDAGKMADIGSFEALQNFFNAYMLSSIPQSKGDSPAFIPATFLPQEQWSLSHSANPSFRNDSNVDTVNFLVLDLDEKGAMEKAVDVFKSQQYFVHSTYSYSPETPEKQRMIVQLDSPVKAADWRQFITPLIKLTGADPACCSPSFNYALPCRANALNDYVFTSHDGQALSLRGRNQILKQHGIEPEAINTKSNGAQNSYSNSLVEYRHNSHANKDYKRRNSWNEHILKNEGGRHDFALKTISREVLTMQERVNLKCLCAYIAEAINRIQDKNILSGGSNIYYDLPRLVHGAICKENSRFLNPTVLNQPLTNTALDGYDKLHATSYSDIVELSNAAKKEMLSGNMLSAFPAPVTSPLGGLKKHDLSINDYTYGAMQERNADAVRAFEHDMDSYSFTVDVMNKEIAHGNKHGNDPVLLAPCISFLAFNVLNQIQKSPDSEFDKKREFIKGVGELIPALYSLDVNKAKSGLSVESFNLAVRADISLLIAKHEKPTIEQSINMICESFAAKSPDITTAQPTREKEVEFIR